MGNGLILGIESSCDETAAAVVERGVRTLSSVVASQIDTHARYGGVVPELASREHLRAIVPVVDAALKEAGIKLSAAQGEEFLSVKRFCVEVESTMETLWKFEERSVVLKSLMQMSSQTRDIP